VRQAERAELRLVVERAAQDRQAADAVPCQVRLRVRVVVADFQSRDCR